jgi:hypothetical protein
MTLHELENQQVHVMRIVLTVLFAVSVSLSGWLWYQLREANTSQVSHVITVDHSRLMGARRIEGMLREGDASAALAELQKIRDVFVLELKSVRSGPSDPPWLWPPRTGDQIERADRALSEEAAYRTTFGESDGPLATQVVEALASYRE